MTAPEQIGGHGRPRVRWTSLAKAAVGVTLLVVLVFGGRIDLGALSALADAKLAIALCIALVIVQIPLAALRWSILLRAVGAPIPFGPLFHFVSIGLLATLFLFGPAGGDAVRGVYAWRALGRGGGRVAASLVADRLFSLLALLSLAVVFTLFNWRWIQQIPTLAVLSTSLFLAFAAGIVGVTALFLFPRFAPALETTLSRWPLASKLVTQIRRLMLALRSDPLPLVAAFVLALLTQIFTVAAVVVIAQAIKIGTLGAVDYLFAVPLTLLANSLPLTPNGLGIGEVAFNEICHLLEKTPSDAAYSTIFFAYRTISLVASFPGLVSLVIYRKAAPEGG